MRCVHHAVGEPVEEDIDPILEHRRRVRDCHGGDRRRDAGAAGHHVSFIVAIGSSRSPIATVFVLCANIIARQVSETIS